MGEACADWIARFSSFVSFGRLAPVQTKNSQKRGPLGQCDRWGSADYNSLHNTTPAQLAAALCGKRRLPAACGADGRLSCVIPGARPVLNAIRTLFNAYPIGSRLSRMLVMFSGLCRPYVGIPINEPEESNFARITSSSWTSND